MPKNRDKLLRALILSIMNEIKISHKDIAIEKGVGLRAVRQMKKENIRAYKLFEDSLKFRKVLGELDLRIKVEVSETENTYWLYYQDEQKIGFDINSIVKLGLNAIEMKNLHNKEIFETTIADKNLRDSLIEKYCGSVEML